MDDTPQAALRVALLAQDCQRGEFRALLENEGIEVVLDGCFDFPLPQSWNGAEVLLVDMGGIPKRDEVESVLRQVAGAGTAECRWYWRKRYLAPAADG